MSEPPPPLPRFGLAAVCLMHAAILGAAACALPWRSGTGFALALALLCALHVSTAAAALSRRRPWLLWSWRALSAASLLTFLVIGWAMAAAALYVGKLYLRLGPAVAFGVLLAAALLAVFTLPIAIWGALRTLPLRTRLPRRLGTGAVVLLGFELLTLPLASRAALGSAVPAADSELGSELRSALEEHSQQPAQGRPRSVAGAGPAICEEPVSSEHLTLFVSYVGQKKPRSVCVQATTSRRLRRALSRVLQRARPGSPVVVDLVKSYKPLRSTFALLDALELRPGVDGVCEELRCLPAWQLLLSDTFSTEQPIPALPSLSYGFSAESVRRALDSKLAGKGLGIDGLVRIETESFSADASGVHRLIRTRSTPPALSRVGVAEAVSDAQRNILAAQEKDGTFRYMLDPLTGREDRSTLNLPRQAGTTYALCELGRGPRIQRAVRKALSVFEATERKLGDASALGLRGDYGLGKSALPLLALLRCRDLVGDENDRLIGRLSRLVLRMQRDDGSFYPFVDTATGRGVGEHEAVYAAGQAVLSLVLLEQRLGKLSGGAAEPLPSAGLVDQALDRAMAYYAGPYWPALLRDFFFLEEGWHCLAARTALGSHRNDAYERLCLDYVGSRKRWILREGDTSEPNFVGGYGVSDLFPPRNTATAGLGEALAASIAIKQKRGLAVDEDKALMRDVVGFLLRAQWSEAECYACRDPELVEGGFSQQLDSPSIRIDYVQHAMAAIAHGAELLALP